jgi:hypothetical protein
VPSESVCRLATENARKNRTAVTSLLFRQQTNLIEIVSATLKLLNQRSRKLAVYDDDGGPKEAVRAGEFNGPFDLNAEFRSKRLQASARPI